MERGTILNSRELDNYGAVIQDNFAIPFVVGAAMNPDTNSADSEFVPHVIRRKTPTIWKMSLMNLKKIAKKSISFLSWKSGFLVNFFTVMTYLIIVFGIPLAALLLVIWSIQLVMIIDNDINKPIFNLMDIFNSSSTYYWREELQYIYFYYLTWVGGIIYAIFGLLELICFICTDDKDTGRIPAVKNKRRWIVSNGFWIMLYLYIGFFAAYFAIVLLWCILGSILNPETFLPLASGAGVIMASIFFLLTSLRATHRELSKTVDKVIDEQLELTIFSNIKKNKNSSQVSELVSSSPALVFNKTVNNFMALNDFKSIDRNITDEILNGNVGMLLKVMNVYFGIDQGICFGIVGILIKDPTLILHCVHKISNKLHISSEINVAFCELAMNQWNSESKNIKEQLKSFNFCMKNLTNELYPDFPTELIDNVTKVLIEKNISPLRDILQKKENPTKIYDLAIAVMSKNTSEIQKKLRSLSEEIMPKRLFAIFYSLNKIMQKNVFGDTSLISKVFAFEDGFSIDLLFALYIQDEESVRHSTLQGIEAFCKEYNGGINSQLLKTCFLSLSVITSGKAVNFSSLGQNANVSIPMSKIHTLQKGAQGDPYYLSLICENLGIGNMSTVICELADMFLKKKVNLKNTGSKLGIPSTAGKITRKVEI